MKMLLTGFGTFPGIPVNRSQQLIDSLIQVSSFGDVDLQVCLLPTEYSAASELIESRLATSRPDICLCTGVAPIDQLRLETTARNAHSEVAAPDAIGEIWHGPVTALGKPKYISSFPWPDISAVLEQHAFRVSVSNDAGGYVCNHVFYRACQQIERLGIGTACGFLHIPSILDESSDSWLSIGRLTKAIELIASTFAKGNRSVAPCS